MKKKDLIEQLVSEIETGRIRTLGIYGHGASGKSTHQMRREQYLRYYRETESKADILVDQSQDKFKVKMTRII